jgi:hypothetical protein
MRTAILAAGAALVALAGCETFEPYSVDYQEIINDQGVSVYSNEMEDFSGERWIQFSASNGGSYLACVQIRITSGNTSGHRMGDTYLLRPGDTTDIGYVTLPASFDTNSRVWSPEPDGSCGPPPN